MEGFFQDWSKSRVGILSKEPVAMQRQSRPSMLVILVTPRMCGTSFQDPQVQKKTKDMAGIYKVRPSS